MRKIPKETKLEAVRAIVRGELLVKEAMHLYHIKHEKTIIGWIKLLLPEVKENCKRVLLAKAVESAPTLIKKDNSVNK
ncbi:hypothetical protein [Sphingobacterium anhuiense]|uniref:Transposase n=1 Tax=Sphingobacterium anhuiense TaxID=493780 RepID=A0ABW5YZT2_9SPHI